MRSSLITLALASLAPLAAAQGPGFQTVPPGVDQGRGEGQWLEPGLFQAGMLHGELTASDGTLRYAMLGQVQPLQGRTGTFQAVLTDLVNTGEGIVGPKPYPLMQISGIWMDAGPDQGVFSGVVYIPIDPLPIPAVLGQIQGAFDLAPAGPLDQERMLRARLASQGPASPHTASAGQASAGKASLAGPQLAGGVILCPKGPELAVAQKQKHPGAQLAEPGVAGGKIVCPKGPGLSLTGKSLVGAAPASASAAAAAAGQKFQVQSAGKKSPVDPAAAGVQRRGLFEAHWYLDS